MKSEELSHLERNLIDLGKIVLKCQLIEHSLASILALMRHDSSKSAADVMKLLADCRTKTLEQLINELKLSGHPAFSDRFVDDLRTFCKSRNLIIHNLMLSTDFSEAIISKSDHLKPFLDSFSGLVEILLELDKATRLTLFPETAVTPHESTKFDFMMLEQHNSLMRHFMSEKWEAKGKRLKSE